MREDVVVVVVDDDDDNDDDDDDDYINEEIVNHDTHSIRVVQLTIRKITFYSYCEVPFMRQFIGFIYP